LDKNTRNLKKSILLFNAFKKRAEGSGRISIGVAFAVNHVSP
jgi:hypothetical protein